MRTMPRKRSGADHGMNGGSRTDTMRFLNAFEGQAHDCANATAACDFAEEKWSGRRGSNPQLSAWECSRVSLYFRRLQKPLRKLPAHTEHGVLVCA